MSEYIRFYPNVEVFSDEMDYELLHDLLTAAHSFDTKRSGDGASIKEMITEHVAKLSKAPEEIVNQLFPDSEPIEPLERRPGWEDTKRSQDNDDRRGCS